MNKRTWVPWEEPGRSFDSRDGETSDGCKNKQGGGNQGFEYGFLEQQVLMERRTSPFIRR